MQTFLPYPEFDRSAACLDRQRLGKQRIEVIQVLNTLRSGGNWRNHPAVLMWRGYENALVDYGIAVCREWIRRGYKDTCRYKIEVHRNGVSVNPPWLGDRRLHDSHRSNLLRKNAAHYSANGWTVGPELPYAWPSADGKTWKSKHSATSEYSR